MINRAILQGRLVADPDLRRTQNGTDVVSFRIACDRDYKSKDPNAQNVDFINIVAWRHTAEFVNRYFTKGSMILVDGRIQVRDYTDNNGQKRYVTEIVAENVNFAGSKKESGGQSSSQSNYSQYNGQNSYAAPASYGPGSAAATAPNEFQEYEDDDGELPF